MTDTRPVELYSAVDSSITVDWVYVKERGYRRIIDTNTERLPLTGEGVVAAIIDTGVLEHHPDIAARLDESVDFTGEGSMDVVGHGTAVALLYLTTAPDSRIVSLKVLGADKRGSEDSLINALNWVAARDDVRVANLSAGLLNLLCDADCRVCVAARNVVASGTFLVVAAGNHPGFTTCPAQAGGGVMALAVIDPRLEALEPYSGNAGENGLVMQEVGVVTQFVSSDGQPLADN